MTEKRYVSARHVAQMLGLSNMTIYRMIADGRLPGVVRLSAKSMLIDIDKVDEWLEKGGIDGDKK